MLPLRGYWSVSQAVRVCEHERGETRSVAAEALREALQCGELHAAASWLDDGALVTMTAADWRALISWHVLGGEPPPPTMAFDDSLEGRPAKLRRGQAVRQCFPMIGQADLARWLGSDTPPPEPLERPADWPAPTLAPALPGLPAELAKAWMHGYATRARDTGPPPKRDDKAMIDACRTATGCTFDDARAAYSALPRELRNPSPNERRSERQGAEK